MTSQGSATTATGPMLRKTADRKEWEWKTLLKDSAKDTHLYQRSYMVDLPQQLKTWTFRRLNRPQLSTRLQQQGPGRVRDQDLFQGVNYTLVVK